MAARLDLEIVTARDRWSSVMGMPRRRLIAAVLASFLVGCSPQVTEPPRSPMPTQAPVSSTPPPSASTPTAVPTPTLRPTASVSAACGDVITAPDPRGASAKSLAVFSTPAAISVYDIPADSVAAVDEGASIPGRRPRFRTPGLISFVRQREPFDDAHIFGQDSLYELDLASGEAVEILRFPDTLLGYDWSPDGTQLAYQLFQESSTETLPISLCVLDIRSSVVRHIRSLSFWPGRDGAPHDEVSMAWSPTGAWLLVVDTIEQPSIYVVDPSGRDVVSPRDGTFARWLSDDQLIFQVNAQDSTKPWPWKSASATTGDTQAFGLPDSAFRPAISPDGAMIAFDDGDGFGDAVSIYVFDVAKGTSRRLASGYVAPIWLGSNTIAATAAGECPANTMCPFGWFALSSTIGIDPASGERHRLRLPTTLSSDAIFGVIDVHLAAN